MDEMDFAAEGMNAILLYVAATMPLIARAVEHGLATPDELAAIERSRSALTNLLFEAEMTPEQVDEAFDDAERLLRLHGLDDGYGP